LLDHLRKAVNKNLSFIPGSSKKRTKTVLTYLYVCLKKKNKIKNDELFSKQKKNGSNTLTIFTAERLSRCHYNFIFKRQI